MSDLKKLTKEELDAIREYADCLEDGSILSKVLSHIAALEGEVEEADNRRIEESGEATKRFNNLLKDRDKRIAQLEEQLKSE